MFAEEVLDMSQYKGYYTAGSSSSRGESQEADYYRAGGGRGESQEQDCTEYADGNGTAEYDTEYDLGDPGGTSAKWRSNMVDGKRSHDQANLQAGRLDQVSNLVITWYQSYIIVRLSNLKSF